MSGRSYLRDFYEHGYRQEHVDGAAQIAAFAALPATSRTHVAAEMLKGAGGALLDVGCGSGAQLWLLRSQFSRLAGVDIAESQLAKARAWAAQTNTAVDLRSCNLDEEDLPWPANSFDTVTCIVTLEFLVDPGHALKECARVLKLGGRLVASVGNIAAPRNRVRLLFGLEPYTSRFQGALNGGALHYFTGATFVALLGRSGFTIERVVCSGRLWRPRAAWPSLLGNDVVVLASKRAGEAVDA